MDVTYYDFTTALLRIERHLQGFTSFLKRKNVQSEEKAASVTDVSCVYASG